MAQSKGATAAGGLRGTTHVSFVCQRCYQPLRLDHSFNSFDAETLKELTAPLSSSGSSEGVKSENTDETMTKDMGAESLESPNMVVKNVPATRSNSSEGNGFTLLGDASDNVKTDNLSHKLKVSARLFDIMSGQSEVDHPLCEECTDSLLNQLDQQLHIAEKELHDYKHFLEESDKFKESEEEEEELDRELEKLRKEERDLLNQLESIESEREKIKTENEKLDAAEKKLKEEEERYWKDYCVHKKALTDFEDQQISVKNQLQYAQSQLDKLRKTNVFNNTFHIWHKGHFGTINGFRLGRLPSVPVEWTEINAAWGQTVLLLHSLSKKIGLTFKRFRLVPYGNHSYIECLEEKMKELPLYGSGGFRFFWDTKFDQAMVAFLDCLQQFKEEVERGDSGFYLPYRMEKGKIFDSRGTGSYSVRIQFNSEEHWTKALKFMLTNLKWGLAWVSSQFADKS
eukprot:Seg2372.3 transcript_id=Seg2372.3/GoldUCD/mRNA.D3Y31 product=Beclin-1 protein_id=Seg2372.3/GoldUCD/D3Y31